MNKLKRNKILGIVILLIFIFVGVIIYSCSKITNFEECENAGWLVRDIKIYDSVGGYDFVEKECTLWTGKSFLKQSLFFPTQKKPTTTYMQALLSGKLEMVDGCLRVNGDLVIWPYGFSATIDEDGIIQVIDSAHEIVVRVGDKVRFGGGGGEMTGGDSGDIKMVSDMLPDSRCSGPYWILGKIGEPTIIYPKTTGITYFDDWKLINNTNSFLIKTIKPLAEEQIQILRNSSVRKLSTSEIENIYHSLIEENKIKEVEKLDFVDYTYHYPTK